MHTTSNRILIKINEKTVWNWARSIGPLPSKVLKHKRSLIVLKETKYIFKVMHMFKCQCSLGTE